MQIKDDKRDGIAALALSIFTGLFLFSMIVLLANQGNTSIFSGQFNSQADRAQFLAASGIQDARIRIARDKTVSGSYTLTETDGSIAISISTTSNTVFIINVTSTVAGAGGVTTYWTKQAQITIDSDGKITAVSETNN